MNRMEEELPSTSDLAKADEFELQEMTENTVKSMKNLTAQLDNSEDLPMCELISLDKQLRSIRGLLKVETAKRLSYSSSLRKKSVSLRNFKTILESTMMTCEKKSRSKSKGIMMN